MNLNETATRVRNKQESLSNLLIEAYEFLHTLKRSITMKDPATEDDDIRSEILLRIPEYLEQHHNTPIESQILTAWRWEFLSINRKRQRREALLNTNLRRPEGVCDDDLSLIEYVDKLFDDELWGFAFKAVLDGESKAKWAKRLGMSSVHFRRLYKAFLDKTRTKIKNLRNS